MTAAWILPESAVQLLAVTVPRDWAQRSMATNTRMLTRAVAAVVMQPKISFWVTRVMVLDDDLDPTDLRDVMWAWTTRSHPTRGQVPLEDQRITPLRSVLLAGGARRRGRHEDGVRLPAGPRSGGAPAQHRVQGHFPSEIQRRALAVWDVTQTPTA